MAKSKKDVLSLEVYKYPYCGRPDENEDYLSEKICCWTIKIRKKIVRRMKRLFVYGQLILPLGNGLAPTQAIGLPILPNNPAIMRSIHSDAKKEVIIAQIVQQMPEMDFTKKEMDELYHLSVKYKNNSLSQEEFITKINNLRGGADVKEVIAALGVISATIILLMNDWGLAFKANPNGIIPPHLQWLYGNNYKPGQFGYGKGAGPRRTKIRGMVQNAGSDKKDPSSGSFDYKKIMRELDGQTSKKTVDIQVGDQIYTLKNSYRRNVYVLSDELADQIYDSIRESDTDICNIAQNLGFKAENIKNVKDHVFYNEHDLDRYDKDNFEHKRFDATLTQALAWKRLEIGTQTQDDITWIKHECAERHHELKYGSGYDEAHNRAQTRFDGAPWDIQF